jgi:hypothetical protein
MPKPMAICIEDLDPQSKTRYLRCVALPGRQPGLCLDRAGSVLWQNENGVSCELWVSADQRLILYRPEAKIPVPVTLRRAGRSLDVPCGKPVVVIDKDQIDVGSRHLRIHVHGKAPSVAAPSPLLSRPRSLGRLAQAATAAALIGAVAATGGCTDIDVRENPPEPVEPTPENTVPPTIEVIENPPEVMPPQGPLSGVAAVEAIQGEWIAAQAYDVEGERVWITGTLTIEENWYTFASTRAITGTSQGDLDFLFDNPRGEVTIDYGPGVAPNDDLGFFFPGDELATCVFRADSEVLGEFQILLGDVNSLHFYGPSSEDGLWSVVRTVETGTGG